MLDAFATDGIRATFFVCAGVARGRPAIVRELAARGHEVACHGLLRTQHRDCTPAKFRCDVAALKRTLENITAAPAAGFRAAGFSMTRWALPALEILAEEGFVYDSSIRAALHRRLPHSPSLIRTHGGALLEFPLTIGGSFASKVASSRYKLPPAMEVLVASFLSSSIRASKLPAVLPLELAAFSSPRATAHVARFMSAFWFDTAAEAAADLLAAPRDGVRELELARMLPMRTRLWRYIYEIESY